MASAEFRSLAAGTDSSVTYQCTTCGSQGYSVIRADAVNPRLKCSSCGFIYNGQDSKRAQEAGAIGESSAETLAATDEPERVISEDGEVLEKPKPLTRRQDPVFPQPAPVEIPQRPKYVFITKDRTHFEFCTAKDYKRVVLRWHDLKYDAYELTPKKFNVDIKEI